MQRNKADSGISTWNAFVIGASDGDRVRLQASHTLTAF